MNTLIIVFAGLVAHVFTNPGGQRAVLLSAPGHVAHLFVRAIDVVEVAGVIEENGSGSDRVFNLSSEHLTFLGLVPGDVVLDGSYTRYVPSLPQISDGTTLLPEVARGEPSTAVTAYVDLVGGKLSVRELHDHPVSFGDDRWPTCLARSVVFTGAAIAETVDVITSHGMIRVRSNATLRIENEPLISTGASHFHMYARLFTDASYVRDPVDVSGTCAIGESLARHRAAGVSGIAGFSKSDLIRPNPREIMGSGCSNSGYP